MPEPKIPKTKVYGDSKIRNKIYDKNENLENESF